jgi:hypothetical protein
LAEYNTESGYDDDEEEQVPPAQPASQPVAQPAAQPAFRMPTSSNLYEEGEVQPAGEQVDEAWTRERSSYDDQAIADAAAEVTAEDASQTSDDDSS